MKQGTQKLYRRLIAIVCAAAMVLSGILSDVGTMAVWAAAEHTLWLVGDSTVCEFNDLQYYPRYGYGTQIKNYLDDTYEVRNLALSGTSSKSYLTQNNYNTLKSGIKAGDTLVIGFGHNDEKAEEARYTNPNGDWQTEGSFAKSLYDNYVKVAQDVGAEVILCTPIVRRTDKATFSDDKLHITADSGTYKGGDYPAAIRKLGADKSIPVVDLTELTKELYTTLGPEETLYLHAWSSSNAATVDNTHLNLYGAKYVAWLFAKGVKETNAGLAAHITPGAAAPEKDLEAAKHPDYIPPEYDPNLPGSELWSDYNGSGDGEDGVRFKGTVFGDLGDGEPKEENYLLETDADGNMHIQVLSNKGAIAEGADGIAMYYYKLPGGSQFEFSARATVHSISDESGAAFGLMARDDMYIDKDGYISSDYVAAGSLGIGCNCFYRHGGTLGGMKALEKETVAAGGVYNLSIVSNSDGYACAFGSEEGQSAGYDFHLNSVDADSIYIGMFAAKNADVTYSNLYLKVDGEVLIDNRKTEYPVTVSSDEHGTARSNTTSAAAGETVKLIATPDEGYILKEWKVTGGNVTVKDEQFTMPAAEVKIQAVFEELRTEWDFSRDNTIAGENGIRLAGGKGAVAGLQIDATNGSWDSTGSLTGGWVQVGQGTVITVPVAGAGKVTVYAQTADYTVDGQKAAVANGEETFIVKGQDRKVTIVATAATALKLIRVKAGSLRTIDVWDFGAKEETDTDTYTNHITPTTVRSAGVVTSGVYSAVKDKKIGTVYGDLAQFHENNDRFYSDNSKLSDLNNSKSATGTKNEYSDGYKAAGAWYCNGSGAKDKRYMTIANVKAGDKIVAYMGSLKGSSDVTFHFEGQGEASAQKETTRTMAADSYDRFEFVAEYDGTYAIWPEGGKPMYHRVMRVPGVTVSGTIDFGEYTGTGYSVKFVNQTTKSETEAVVEDGTFTAVLAAGYTYRAVLSGAVGFGFALEGRDVTTTNADAITGKEGVALVVEPKSTYTYSGKITGFADGYDISKLSGAMVPAGDSTADEAPLTIDTQLNFTATLQPDVAYTVQLGGVNDYEVKTPAKVEASEDFAADITVALKPVHAVTGGFRGIGTARVTKLTFTNVEDEYAYTAAVTDEGYSVSLRDGAYLAQAEVTGYTTRTHVVVNGEAVNKDLLFVSTAQAGTLPKASDIYVGYPKKANNYATMREALAACAAMNPTSEAERITIHIAPGTYREQLIVTTPYVSFVNDTEEEVLLTWYYGIGYQYYSIGADGFYNEELAYDQYGKKSAEKWGAAVYVKNSATAFRAEGITFENSFNRYITDEEIDDGVEVSGEESINVKRKYGTDVQTKAATERAAALVVEADKAEFRNCGFLGSQDTLQTGNTASHLYFKDCLIAGQSDYIFGDGNAVFDTCELRFAGYSANSQGGYITATKTEKADKGYLFRNCSVTAGEGLTVTPGYFGRPWLASAHVVFLNTKLEKADLIVAAGWTEMNNVKPENVAFYEYNTTTLDGTAVSTSGRKGKVMTQAEASAVKPADYFGSWTPAFYREEAEEIAFTRAPFVTDNGDLNTPYPGHKLTVGYSLGAANDANDASVIQWYRVKDDKETLVKLSNAVLDKTYKITKDDVGSYIKVTVTPTTVSGRAGTAASYTVEAVVGDGYEDPDATGGDVALGEGVNIFLAGDSTVKDYSAKGINSGGTARNEGAWGEFLQSYFNSDKVTVVNYANGGRSSRNFINEGSLDKIADKIGEGDYLFIQFGHNDCSNGSGYLADRYVPLGTPDANGVYPSTPGVKKETPAELAGNKYGDTCYTYDCGGTFKWYLQQYIDVAKKAGATPVLVTPVSRMYYITDGENKGTIKPHHDSTDATTNTQVTSNNAYVTAVRQLAEEQDVLLVDGFELTKTLFEDAYKACGSDVYGTQIMHTGDKTHNNKLGGMIEAAAIASAIQKMDLNISYAVKAPGQVLGETTDGSTVFMVSGSGKFTAYDINSDYKEKAAYWESLGQKMFDDIAAKAEELGGSKNPNDPEQPIQPVKGEGLEIVLADPDAVYTYTGAAIQPELAVFNNGELLTEGTDYTVKYSNNVKAAEAGDRKAPTITVTGKGSFAGKTTQTFTIGKKDLSDEDVLKGDIVVAKKGKAVPVLIYNGMKLGARDYEFVNRTDASKKFEEDGTIQIQAKAGGNYKTETPITLDVTVVTKLQKLNIVVDTRTRLTYNGEEQIPDIKVYDKDDKTKTTPLTPVTDYIISYSGDKTSAGTQKFTVIGMGKYTGSTAKSYKINPRRTTLSLTNDDADASGAVSYGFNSAGVTFNDALTVTDAGLDDKVLVPGKDYKVSYSGNKKVGTNTGKYTVTFLGNYKGSAALKGKFSITAASLEDLDVANELHVVSADKAYTKEAVYKSAPYVLVNGVALKSSDYTVKYYLDPKGTESRREMKGRNKVLLDDGELYKTVYVEIAGKKNYSGEVETSFRVVRADGKTDISKAKITLKDSEGNKQSKVEYTGKAVYPASIVVKAGTNPEVTLTPDASGSWDTDDYTVEFVNNIEKGKATIIISARDGGGCVGSKTATYSVTTQRIGSGNDIWTNIAKMFNF